MAVGRAESLAVRMLAVYIVAKSMPTCNTERELFFVSVQPSCCVWMKDLVIIDTTQCIVCMC